MKNVSEFRASCGRKESAIEDECRKDQRADHALADLNGLWTERDAKNRAVNGWLGWVAASCALHLEEGDKLAGTD